MKVVKVLTSRDGKRRVELFRRANGTYGFEEWYFSEDPYELSWCPCDTSSECFVPDLQTAEAEARGRVDWLRDDG